MDIETQRRSAGSSLAQRSWNESKKIWEIATPATLTALSQFSMGFVTLAFVGHLGDQQLAAVTIVLNIIEGFVYGLMLGIGSALETLCGQAVGAGESSMLGIYLQRSLIITITTAVLLTPIYIFTTPILVLLHQSEDIATLTGEYSVWVIPQLFALAFNFPVQKFLLAQSKVWAMTTISVLALALHVLLNWVLITKLGHGMLGAAMAGNVSWFLLAFAQILYVICGFFPDSWTGFSLSAFKSLAGFVKLSLASGVMLCVELWYYTISILMVGWLKNPTLAVDSFSICMNVQLWFYMISLGFNAAISVRVSNELGAGDAKATKFSILVTIVTATMLGVVFAGVIVATDDYFPRIFSGKEDVIREASSLGYILGAAIFLNSVQPILVGVAVGAGWQVSVSLINIGCYYIFGLPLGSLLGYKFKLGVSGIWIGLLAGAILQTVILFWVVFRANWHEEAIKVERHVRSYRNT